MRKFFISRTFRIKKSKKNEVKKINEDESLKNKFFRHVLWLSPPKWRRFCSAKPAPIPKERKLSQRESHGHKYEDNKRIGHAVLYKRLAKLTALLGIVFTLLFVFFSVYTGEEREIYDKLIRLHVLANSDSSEDQELKLRVRDKILEKSSEFGNLDSIESAEKFYSGKLEMLRDVALETIREEGYDYDVEVSLGREYYPTREYENFRLPAGEYTSLRIMIGNAGGHNWWCVLYPPLCLSSSRSEDAFVDAGFTPDQISFITENDKPKYKVKFRIVELFSDIKKAIFG